MFSRTSRVAVSGMAALVAALGLPGAAAEPAASDCEALERVETELQAELDDLNTYAGSLSSVLTLASDDPDRQSVGEVLRSMADTLQTGADAVTTPSYRGPLERFSALFDRSAQLVLNGEEASPEDIKQIKEQGEDLGSAVDTAYAQACHKTVRV
ncbi:hypothetical protein [Segniliparus rugosus]|uniref:Uncharacterized protein n=1 Tax=Segniliparus rugosus (strain ATCC BAA-974 / DSM 45345 / CCUG 50838 / CIP 108380 / JCM 13579 / CDC 945) TaxID=679197 RepID=E5XTZ9_SEGRC|nr:hypothetical protein [Segniliparus rugosus]EFV12168.2 hypothetical protein HMPREF9336_02971 [Segniliparus rugosus ATCC BAA-974]